MKYLFCGIVCWLQAWVCFAGDEESSTAMTSIWGDQALHLLNHKEEHRSKNYHQLKKRFATNPRAGKETPQADPLESSDPDPTDLDISSLFKIFNEPPEKAPIHKALLQKKPRYEDAKQAIEDGSNPKGKIYSEGRRTINGRKVSLYLQTPLHLAALHMDERFIKYLVKKLHVPLAPINGGGKTPLAYIKEACNSTKYSDEKQLCVRLYQIFGEKFSNSQPSLDTAPSSSQPFKEKALKKKRNRRHRSHKQRLR